MNTTITKKSLGDSYSNGISTINIIPQNVTLNGTVRIEFFADKTYVQLLPQHLDELLLLIPIVKERLQELAVK